MPEPDPSWTYDLLIDALRLVALDASDQHAALPAFVVVPDEIALTLADANLLVDQLVAQGSVTAAQAATVATIDRALAAMSDAQDRDWLWSELALASDSRWDHVRASARAVLAELGVAEGFPSLTNPRYIV